MKIFFLGEVSHISIYFVGLDCIRFSVKIWNISLHNSFFISYLVECKTNIIIEFVCIGYSEFTLIHDVLHDR